MRNELECSTLSAVKVDACTGGRGQGRGANWDHGSGCHFLLMFYELSLENESKYLATTTHAAPTMITSYETEIHTQQEVRGKQPPIVVYQRVKSGR